MLLRIEVSAGGDWNSDERKFRRQFKGQVAALAAELAERTGLELNRIQVVEPPKKKS